MSHGHGSDLPSYRNPPVIEVVCGVRFEPITDLKIGHIGSFWERVRKEFPECEHAAPLDPKPELVDPVTGLPLPRVWFINKAGDRLIQIQNNIFYYNWRKREKGKSYPRYPAILKKFKKYLGAFLAYLEENGLGSIKPTDCELTYVNMLSKNELRESGVDIGRIFPDLKWRSSIKRFLPVSEQIAWSARFPLPGERGNLTVKINPAVRRTDEAPVVQFELKASGLGPTEPLDDIWDWYDIAHEWIVRGFADLAGREIQERIWQRDDSFTG